MRQAPRLFLLFTCLMIFMITTLYTLYGKSLKDAILPGRADRMDSTPEKPNLSKVSTEEKAKYYTTRRWQMVQACQKLNQSVPAVSADVIPNRNRVETQHAIIYCGITKTGSTFWSRSLTVIGSEGKYTSPFQFRLGSVKLISFADFKNKISENEMDLFLKSSTSFMFVREPYGRLLSGYIDKLYHPNSLFWHSVGRKAIQTVRPNPSTDSLRHGHDLTFAEFVKFIIARAKTGGSIDQHFSPMYKKCNPCQYQYDFIGKMETFKEDTEWLLNQWHQTYSDVKLKFEDIESEKAIDSATGHVRLMFGAKRSIQDTSYPPYNVLLRTWRIMQSRGMLPKTTEMPITHEQAKTISQEEFSKVLTDAILRPMDRSLVKHQREEALTQAYRSVPQEDMEELRQFVMADCKYFGYDDRPEKLFLRPQSTDTGVEFNYFDGLSVDNQN